MKHQKPRAFQAPKLEGELEIRLGYLEQEDWTISPDMCNQLKKSLEAIQYCLNKNINFWFCYRCETTMTPDDVYEAAQEGKLDIVRWSGDSRWGYAPGCGCPTNW